MGLITRLVQEGEKYTKEGGAREAIPTKLSPPPPGLQQPCLPILEHVTGCKAGLHSKNLSQGAKLDVRVLTFLA